MNKLIFTAATALCTLVFVELKAQTVARQTILHVAKTPRLFIDVHRLQPGMVNFDDVAKAHSKDLLAEKKYGVDFKKFWVNEKAGLVYCLSSAPDTAAIRKTHAEAHGLMPERIYEVKDGPEAATGSDDNFFLDVHELGAGKVTADAVAGAHQKDLQVQGKYGVSFINYWVDEKSGVVLCLSQAKDSTSVINTHREAHGLLPAFIIKVKQGQ